MVRRMNALLCYGSLLGLLLIMGGCAGGKVVTLSFPQEKIIHYTAINELEESMHPEQYVVYINEGEKVPLKLSMESDFLDFSQDHIDLVAKQKMYFRVEVPKNITAAQWQELKKMDAQTISAMEPQKQADFFKDFMLFISKDGVNWAPLSGKNAVREVLGYKEGQFSFGMMTGQAEGLGASLDIRFIK
jgi:hypothetical protein